MNRGFTILEVLIASLILAVIGVLSYTALFGTFRTQRILDKKMDLQESGTVILNKIKDDIAQTFY
ncbi:MAG: prepilin-type N-terminal cleavage/methylation domain-containing protein, partial [Bdellovibrionales bacterium]|nr:prepilin-type N-terminal cleavage/methylation domain-containing protein [Bdellovibrionales bacterium]